ncbi:oxidized low-density lipoprotein receptor 1-like isoform X2 [Bacillus rossius redtenbacheri]|uniref:oxidized low-density lipoprotein receptor 1-like isoform X2 n=1 Tax=Bacillus rossius redtenbacheri TaxID=93214 RepID=UPI002FDE8C2C
MTKKCFEGLLLATAMLPLLSLYHEAEGQATNFTVAQSLTHILRSLDPGLDQEEGRSYSPEGLWAPVLEQRALQPRSEKVMKQKPSAAAANYVVSRPTVGGRPGPAPSEDVSETDLYLLGAIEKLAYRVDFMEKRLRRTEELLYYVMSGDNDRHDRDPCPANFTRVGKGCYHFGERQFNWKSSASMCKSLGAGLAELESIEENQDVVTFLQSHKEHTGKDFWTGGLNPGLLWIWANSARPVASNSTSGGGPGQPAIHGTGRCLQLAYSPALRSYRYQGEDCAERAHYLCEREDNRAGRALRRLEAALRQQRSG